MTLTSMAINPSARTVEKPYYQSREAIAREQKLVEAAQRDPEAFKPLYERYHEPVFRFVYQRMNDRDQAFDVTAQVFLKALQNLKRYQFRGLPFASWLFRIAISEANKCFNQQKAARAVNIRESHLKDLFEDIPESTYERYRDAMISAIAELPETELQLIEMRFFEQRSFKEIGEILDLKETNAKIKTYRVLKKLKRWITSNTQNS